MKVVFLDRDGVINKDKGYVYRTKDFEFVETIFTSLRYLNNKGFNLIIITNQSGIGRGYYKEQDFKHVNDWMLQKFNANDVTILDVSHCPHKPKDNCTCRKPKTGMLEAANDKYGIDKINSWMIGDKESDIEAALNFGITNTILIKNDCGIERDATRAKIVISSIKEICNYIK